MRRSSFIGLIGLAILLMIPGIYVFGQCEAAKLREISPSAIDVVELKKAYGDRKQIPEIYKTQILAALSHFPELRNTPIRFRIRHSHSPLKTNRDWGYYFGHLGFGRRAFVVTISDSSTAQLSPVLFSRLPFNAQIGVAGHELSHVSNFSHKNLFGWIRLGIGHLSSHYVDKMEFGTDSLCIVHGLGYQLLAWSCYVRSAWQVRVMDRNDRLPFKGRERYMNPSTILARLEN
jgi:hypothetical protein